MQLRAMKIAKENGTAAPKPKTAAPAPARADQHTPRQQHQAAAAGGGRRRQAPTHFDEYDAEDQYFYTDGYKPRRSRTSVGVASRKFVVFFFTIKFPSIPTHPNTQANAELSAESALDEPAQKLSLPHTAANPLHTAESSG